MERSILDLSTEELIQIRETNKLPEEKTLKGIEERKDFDTLYRHRNTPHLLAEILLKSTRISAKGLSPSVKQEKVELEQKRIALKEKELGLRKEKVEGQTFLLKDLKSHLTRIETKLDLLIQELFKRQIKNKKEN